MEDTICHYLAQPGRCRHGRIPYMAILVLYAINAIVRVARSKLFVGTSQLESGTHNTTDFTQLMGTLCLGFMGFSSSQFWMALFMQQIQHLSALEITARLLPMIINGTLVNVICALILHKVSNKLLMLVASCAYAAAFLIMSFIKEDSSYWAFYFPPFLLMVVGADIEFNVANVKIFPVLSKVACADRYSCIDVRHVLTSIRGSVSGWWHIQHRHQTLCQP